MSEMDDMDERNEAALTERTEQAAMGEKAGAMLAEQAATGEKAGAKRTDSEQEREPERRGAIIAAFGAFDGKELAARKIRRIMGLA